MVVGTMVKAPGWLSVRKAMVVWAKMVPTVKKGGMVSETGPAGKSGGVSWQAEFVSRLMASSDFVLGRLP